MSAAADLRPCVWGTRVIIKSFSFAATTMATTSLFLPSVLAQAPANDVISWPSGILLLASVLYAALGLNSESLWAVDPSIGLFLGSGLPIFSLPAMRRVVWVSERCHFLSRIRTAHGISNFWIRADEITQPIRAEVLNKTTSVLHCVTYRPLPGHLDENSWRLTSAGLIAPTSLVLVSPGFKPAITERPSARDFLLFAATDYHAFRHWTVEVYRGDELLFSTAGMPASSVIDVDSEEDALAVVAAQMVRRPYSQTRLRDRASHQGPDGEGVYTLDLIGLDLDAPICAIDFHSYSPEFAKVSASLRELALSYYRVVLHIKEHANAPNWLVTGQMAEISVGQTLWISIFGGALLDKGRVTIQNLPGRWAVKGNSADQCYLDQVEAVLQQIQPYANTPKFFDLVFSGGVTRRPTYAFLVAGLCGQIIICYFLSVGTSAGVWTSVALANSLYSGRLTDWHSMFFGRTEATAEPGMKMYVPDSPSKEVMVVATFDRSAPRTGELSPGFLLNVFGLIGATLGAIFQEQTRTALGFGPVSPTADWVIYTSVVLSMGTTFLVLGTIILQQVQERTWFHDSELPTRWAIYTTTSASITVCALAAFFARCHVARLWPVLDALTWISGFALGVLENGRIISMDDNILHLVLVNRWILGAVSSSVGSTVHGFSSVCFQK